jgi:hypothetical protein
MGISPVTAGPEASSGRSSVSCSGLGESGREPVLCIVLQNVERSARDVDMLIRFIRLSPIRQQAYQIHGIKACRRLLYVLHNY